MSARPISSDSISRLPDASERRGSLPRIVSSQCLLPLANPASALIAGSYNAAADIEAGKTCAAMARRERHLAGQTHAITRAAPGELPQWQQLFFARDARKNVVVGPIAEQLSKEDARDLARHSIATLNGYRGRLR